MQLTPFHIAVQIRDIDEARDFYGVKMGLSEGRSMGTWIDFKAMLWISNGIIALSFFSLSQYISHPTRALYAQLAGVGLILYPFFRTLVEVWNGINLTSHVAGVEVSIDISSEKLFFIVFGMALLGVASAWAELNKSSNQTALPPVL